MFQLQLTKHQFADNSRWKWKEKIKILYELFFRLSRFSLRLISFGFSLCGFSFRFSHFQQIVKFINFVFFSCLFADDKTGTLDGALDTLYCRSQMYLSRQISRLRPELTMPIFSGYYWLLIKTSSETIRKFKMPMKTKFLFVCVLWTTCWKFPVARWRF